MTTTQDDTKTGSCSVSIDFNLSFADNQEMLTKLDTLFQAIKEAGFPLQTSGMLHGAHNGQPFAIDLQTRQIYEGSQGEPLPFGSNWVSLVTQAMLKSIDNGEELYVMQTHGGDWCYSPYAPADAPFILIQPTGRARLGCDYCESDARARHRALLTRKCGLCEAPTLRYVGMGSVVCRLCGHEEDF